MESGSNIRERGLLPLPTCSQASPPNHSSPAPPQQNCCSIHTLLRHSFSTLPFQAKLSIIEHGRPLDELTLSVQQKGSKVFTRHFNVKLYEVTPWLCGCSTLSRLFCWPCLLFSTERNVWSKTGFDDLSNLHKAQKRHRLSQSHIQAEIQLKKFGITQIEFNLNEQFRLSVEAHNEVVRKNRRMVKHFIKVACFLGKQELAFCGHNEAQNSLNRGNYIELLQEISEFDSELKNHLSNSTVFSVLSSDIQNDIIYSISEYMIREIKHEVNLSPFVAIIMDQTMDIAGKSHLSTVIRYVNKDGSIEERFLGFKNISDDHRTSAVAQHVSSTLEEFNCGRKLVAQTYDGAVVLAREHKGLQIRVREYCPQAIFVHCYAHRLNLVLSQSVSCIKECKIFFISLAGFGTFFSKSTKRTEALDSEIKKQFPSLVPTRWNCNSRLLETVYEHKRNIFNLLTSMTENADEWDTETVITASGLISKLQDFEFNFFLVIFSSIFHKSDVLFQFIQKNEFDIKFCITKIKEFSSLLKQLRKEFDSFWNKTEEVTSLFEYDFPTPRKIIRIDVFSGEDKKSSYRKLFFEIIDVIETDIMNRFSDIVKLKFLRLLDSKRFQDFKNKFPEEDFAILKQSYGNFFDFPRLRSELSVLFKDQELHKESVVDLYRHLLNSDLADVLPEVYTLTKLIITIPAPNASAKKSFSALKRIKTYLRNTQAQERLSSLAFLGIEKVFLARLQRKPSFYNDVINIFASKSQRIQLHYKKEDDPGDKQTKDDDIKDGVNVIQTERFMSSDNYTTANSVKCSKHAKSDVEETQDGFQFVSCETDTKDEYEEEDYDIEDSTDFSSDYIKNENESESEENDVTVNSCDGCEEQEASLTNVAIKEEVDFTEEDIYKSCMRDFS